MSLINNLVAWSTYFGLECYPVADSQGEARSKFSSRCTALPNWDPSGTSRESCGRRVYIGNIDHRISEATLIRLFAPYGKIEFEDIVCHTRGPKRGEPRGFAFIQFSTIEEARLAKEKMHGRLACGRPLVVRLANEKHESETNHSKTTAKAPAFPSNTGQTTSRSAKITAIKNKLRALDDEGGRGKKPKQGDSIA